MITDTLDLDMFKIRYLERLLDFEQANPGTVMDSGAFLMEECGLGLVVALGLTRALDSAGLVKEANSMGSPGAILRDAGRSRVLRVRAQRADAVARYAAARRIVLAYAYDALTRGNESPDPAEVITWPRNDYLGEPLTRGEIMRSADYLAQKALLQTYNHNANGEPTVMQLTALGEDCMAETGGDIAAFFKNQRAGQTIFHTTVSGGQAIAIGSHNITQNINAGLDSTALRELVVQVLGELKYLGDVEGDARAALAEIAHEAETAQPDRGRVSRALGHLLDLAKQIGAPLLVTLLTYKAKQLGILPSETPTPQPSAGE